LADSAYRQTVEEVGRMGFDDIVVLAPSPDAIAEAAEKLAPGGVMNVFAGVKRGTMVNLDLSAVYQENVRFIGHSGLTTASMRIALRQVESGEFSPNRLVAAVGSLAAVPDGLRAVRDGVFSGKVVIFPHIHNLPLTPLPDLKDILPSVYAKLKDGCEWTREAEEEFLRLMLL
jgi:threonine dehydrogenase-like Zn-dependent dehydrogenase